MSQKALADTKYFALLRSIRNADGVECEKYPDLYFPEDIDDPDKRAVAIKVAKALCNACPIKDECFTYAIETNQRYGVWGGTLGHER